MICCLSRSVQIYPTSSVHHPFLCKHLYLVASPMPPTPFFKKVEVHLHVLCLCTHLCMHANKNKYDEMCKDRVHQSGWATMRRVTETAGNDINLGSNCGARGVRTHRLDTRGLKRWPKRIPGSSDPTKGPHFEHLFRDFVRSLGRILLCIFMRPHLLVLGSLL